jgi:hypothetical protein
VKRVWVLLVVAAVVSGVAAYLYYFAWPESLLDTTRIASYSYGEQGVNPLEYTKVTRADDPATFDRLMALVRDAPVARPQVTRAPGRLMLILHRDDGLQYRLFLDGPRGDGTWQVGVSEGDESYLGTLDQPQLVELLRGFEAKLP